MQNEECKIVTEPNDVLHNHAEQIPLKEISSKKIQQVIHDMRIALSAAKDGIGIAAPQIGHSLRIFLASEEALRWDEIKEMSEVERKKKWEYFVYINPTIVKQSSKKVHEKEGCLSVPKTYGIVERAEKVTVEAYDELGKKFRRGTTKLYARVMQHEIDHLNGILFMKKAKNIKKL